MHAKHGVYGKSLEQPFVDHHTPASLVFLGGLENELHRAGEVAPGQHGQVRVQRDADSVEITQHLGIHVRDARHRAVVAVGAFRQLPGRRARHLPVEVGNRIAVRVAADARCEIDRRRRGLRRR